MAKPVEGGNTPKGFVPKAKMDEKVAKVKALAETRFAERKTEYESRIAELEAKLAQFEGRTVAPITPPSSEDAGSQRSTPEFVGPPAPPPPPPPPPMGGPPPPPPPPMAAAAGAPPPPSGGVSSALHQTYSTYSNGQPLGKETLKGADKTKDVNTLPKEAWVGFVTQLHVSHQKGEKESKQAEVSVTNLKERVGQLDADASKSSARLTRIEQAQTALKGKEVFTVNTLNEKSGVPLQIDLYPDEQERPKKDRPGTVSGSLSQFIKATTALGREGIQDIKKGATALREEVEVLAKSMNRYVKGVPDAKAAIKELHTKALALEEMASAIKGPKDLFQFRAEATKIRAQLQTVTDYQQRYSTLVESKKEPLRQFCRKAGKRVATDGSLVDVGGTPARALPKGAVATPMAQASTGGIDAMQLAGIQKSPALYIDTHGE